MSLRILSREIDAAHGADEFRFLAAGPRSCRTLNGGHIRADSEQLRQQPRFVTAMALVFGKCFFLVEVAINAGYPHPGVDRGRAFVAVRFA